MTTELVRTEPQLPAPVDFSPERLQLLKDTICKGSTNDELKLFVEICKRKQLDPFARQIHAVKRWDANLQREVMSYQTGIDGFRLIAERTGKYEGQGPPMWCGKDGKWHDVWLSDEHPTAAKATVYRAGFREPLVKVALYREYAQFKRDRTPTSMWEKMPASQLSKCAETLALRAAFPEELSGIYTNDEMGQADNPEPEPQTFTPRPGPVIEPQRQPGVKTWAGVPEDIQEFWRGMNTIPTIVKSMEELQECLAEYEGADSADRRYRAILGKYKRKDGKPVEHSNQFQNFGDARGAARELLEVIKEMKATRQALHVSEADIVEDEPEVNP
jgi:phage recombination protein Bet